MSFMSYTYDCVLMFDSVWAVSIVSIIVSIMKFKSLKSLKGHKCVSPKTAYCGSVFLSRQFSSLVRGKFVPIYLMQHSNLC